MTVEEVRGSLDLTDNGAIKNSIRNCLTVFQNDPVLQGAVRYNILTERIDIVKPLWWSKQTATLTDTDLNYLMLYLEDKYSLTSEKKIQKALSIIADSNKYHPIRDYLNGLEWDGTERIRYALPRFLGAEEGEYTYQALRLFMLGAISRVFKPGCKFEVKYSVDRQCRSAGWSASVFEVHLLICQFLAGSSEHNYNLFLSNRHSVIRHIFP